MWIHVVQSLQSCFQRNVIRPDDSIPGNGNQLGCFCRPRRDVRKTERFESCAAWDCPNCCATVCSLRDVEYSGRRALSGLV
jgi:hypothetical protein